MNKIDIAVPCYQYGHFLGDCLDSILEQDVPGLRVMVLDNASQDNSLEVAREYALKDARVHVTTHTRNIGATAIYNEAIDWASGDYFLLIDADDILAPGALSAAVKLLDEKPGVAMACGIEVERTFGAGERDTLDLDLDIGSSAPWSIESGSDFIRRQCAFERFIGSPTALRRTAAQKAAGYYRAELPFSDDMELWLRLALQGDVAVTDAALAVRRRHGGQITEGYRGSPSHMFSELFRAYESFFQKEGRDLGDARRMLALCRSKVGRSALYNGLSQMRDGDSTEGVRLLRLATKLSPSFALPRIAKHLLTMDAPMQQLRALLLPPEVPAR